MSDSQPLDPCCDCPDAREGCHGCNEQDLYWDEYDAWLERPTEPREQDKESHETPHG